MVIMNSTAKLGDLKYSVDQPVTQRNTWQKVFYNMKRTINENQIEAFPTDTIPPV